MANSLYIVIPAYNEAMNIEAVVRGWHSIAAGIGPESRLVVVNDGSGDGTGEVLRTLQKSYPQLIGLDKENGGHGAAVLYGYRYALDAGADYIFQTDSDGQTLPEEFAPFWADRARFDAIFGHRNHRQDGFSRLFVTKTLKLVLLCIFGLNITDANTPYRLMSRRVLEKYLPRIPQNFNLPNVMLTVLMADGGENVDFRPITFRPRQGGVNSINLPAICGIGLQAVRDFSRIRREMKQYKATHREDV